MVCSIECAIAAGPTGALQPHLFYCRELSSPRLLLLPPADIDVVLLPVTKYRGGGDSAAEAG